MTQNKLTLAHFSAPGSLEGYTAQPNWLAGPCALTGDSEPLEESNFDCMIAQLQELDPNLDNWNTIVWEHFGVSWLEVMFYNPECPFISTLIAEISAKLVKSRILDPHLFWEYVEELQQEKEVKTTNA